MQYTLALLAGFAAVGAYAAPQGVTSILTPTASAPAGCKTDAALFQISVTTLESSKAKRASTLEVTLADGILTDESGQRGYIAANYQLQFNNPVQDGAIYTGGFSACANNTLALGDSALWYECLSGTFYNIYDENWAAQCKAIYLDMIYVSSSASASTATATGSVATATTGASAVTSSAAQATYISDGQVQGATATSAVTSSVEVVTTVSATTSSAALVSSISDHQIQGATTTSAVVSSATLSSTIVVSVSATSAAVLSSTTSAALLSTISDHQVQAPTATTALVTAYSGIAAMPTMAAQIVLAAAGAAVLML